MIRFRLSPRTALVAPAPAVIIDPEPPVADPLARGVAIAKVRIALRASIGILSAGIVAVALILLALSYDGAGWAFTFTPPALGWAAATLALTLNGVALRLRFQRGAQTDDDAMRTVRRLVANAGAMGAAWGSSAFLLLPSPSLAQDGFLLIAVAMVMIAGAVPQSVHRPLVTAYCASLALVFAAGLARLGEPLHVLLAIGYVAYGAAVLMVARNQEHAAAASIELGLRNDELLAQRTFQRHAAERAQAEAEEARERAEKAHKSKSTFIAAVSHDLRQPMHALVQYVGHLKRVNRDPFTESTIDKIETSVGAMADLLNTVLDFSKIAMGSVKPVIEPVHAGRLLDSVETQVRPLAHAKGLALHIECRASHLLGDAVLVERMLRNIAQNAVRYTPAGAITIRAVARGAVTRLLVADTGIGIPSAERERIFDEYYQVDNPARDRRKGLGLGLAIVRDLAELQQARVRLKSVVGRGSCFMLEFPTAPLARRVEPLRRAGAPFDCVRGAFVVLIEDDPLARSAVVTTLQDFGCRVLAVASGVEALHALATAEFAPQLVISDYRLEDGATGLEAIRMVQENQSVLYGADFRLPALVISGDTSPQELESVSAAGYPMLHKPVPVDRLYEAINRMLAPLMAVERQA